MISLSIIDIKTYGNLASRNAKRVKISRAGEDIFLDRFM